jgi:hypothetical protein
MAIHPLHPRAMNRGGEQREQRRGRGGGGKGTSAPDGRGRVREKVGGRKGDGRRERERGRESGEVGLVGKLKLFPDSEWKHFVVAAAAAVAVVVSSFPVTAVHRCPLRNTIALWERARKFEARPSLRERTDSLSSSVSASRFPASPAVSRISASVSIAGVYATVTRIKGHCRILSGALVSRRTKFPNFKPDA